MLTKRHVIVCDIDGVVTRNPDSAITTITSHDYWGEHWNNVGGLQYNLEVVHMLQDLVRQGNMICFMTARPIQYLGVTKALLGRMGITDMMISVWNHSTGHDSFHDAFSDAIRELNRPIVLKMLDDRDIPSSSGKWKADLVKQMLDQGLKVQFMIEDFKHNADHIRQHVPVFLYERVK